MPQTSMDYWVIGGVIIALIALIIAWRQLKGKPKLGKNLDVGVSKSKTVDVGATDKTKANIDVDRSEGVNVKIGSDD